MAINQLIFAGVDVFAGKKPVTFAAIDRELNIFALERWSVPEAISCLQEYEKIVLALNLALKKPAFLDFRRRLDPAGLVPFSKTDPREWLETNSQDCYQALIEQELFSRRTLEGRIQRSLILYDEGFQIPDPMDFFEEITRHKLMQGILPLENLRSAKELDALASAYVAWLTINRPNQVDLSADNFALPKRQEG
jgi:hypothetical protein